MAVGRFGRANGETENTTMMQRQLMVLIVALNLAPCPRIPAEESRWLTDLPEALKAAKPDGKIVLLNFTGSDWCYFCKKLEREVFSTQEFKNYAGANLVLMTVDFPRSKQQEEGVKKRNAALKDQYRIRGFPTLVFLDDEGEKLGQVQGYGHCGFPD